MSKKIKNICLSLALAAVVGISAAASACTIQSSHPTAKITISFNGEPYEIEYTLSRNLYPQTVQHFIELADSGFYDNTIIHDYKSSDWVGGAYSYNATVDGNETNYRTAYSSPSSMVEYLENNCKEKAYYDLVSEGIKNGSFSPSVYSMMRYNDKNEAIVENEDALVTLIGEFSANDHKIDGKALTASYGTLKMFYYKKDVTGVAVKNSFGQVLSRDYNYNCATSLFSMQMSNSTSYDTSNYCVFGQLKNDKAKSILEDLIDALSDYKTSLSSSSTLTKSISTQVDKLDDFAGDGGREIDATFTMIIEPIIVKKVEITKY